LGLHARASSSQPKPTAISFFMRGSNSGQIRRARAMRSSTFLRDTGKPPVPQLAVADTAVPHPNHNQSELSKGDAKYDNA
jgi:hypothetical protein